MIRYYQKVGLRVMLAATIIFAWMIIDGYRVAHTHGGKTHVAEPFSSFQAVQKATQLYDQLITADKLEEDWETGLASIHITVRGSGNRREYVVQFKKPDDDPNSVYFYFDRQGEYAGSNFTGE